MPAPRKPVRSVTGIGPAIRRAWATRSRSDTSATRARNVRRVLKGLEGRRYRAGDVLTVRFTAARYRPESARIRFRNGNKPLVS